MLLFGVPRNVNLDIVHEMKQVFFKTIIKLNYSELTVMKI